MYDNHRKIQTKLTDIYYEKKELPRSLSDHMEHCEQCTAFWNNIHIVSKELNAIDVQHTQDVDDTQSVRLTSYAQRTQDAEVEVDYRVIYRAFSKAERIKEERKNLMDFLVFLGAALFLIGIAGWFVFSGYSSFIIKIQLVLMIISPISLPFLIKGRLVKEGN